MNTNQKLIILHGLHNSGKTFLYNLFKKEDDCITLEIYKNHYHLHKDEWLQQVGVQNTERVEKHIQSLEIFSADCFFEEFGILMKQFPDKHFVVKPGQTPWFQECSSQRDVWNDRIKKFTDLKTGNVSHLFAIRHPKISLATCYDHNTNINEYVERWTSKYDLLERYSDVLQIIKIEEIKYVDKPYTEFDLNDYRLNIFDRLEDFKSDLKVIDIELKALMDFLNYDSEDKNVDRYLRELDQLRCKSA